jgi:hypothetical protein
MAGVLRLLGLRFSASQYPQLRKHIERLGLDAEHLTVRRPTNAVNDAAWVTRHLVLGTSRIPAARLKARLVSSGLLENRCSECGIIEWCGQPAPLKVENINGNACDYRIENLRITCANCRSLIAH